MGSCRVMCHQLVLVNLAFGNILLRFRLDVVQDDADHQRELYASIANQLVMTYLVSPAGA